MKFIKEQKGKSKSYSSIFDKSDMNTALTKFFFSAKMIGGELCDVKPRLSCENYAKKGVNKRVEREWDVSRAFSFKI